jgi:hypothetical protein
VRTPPRRLALPLALGLLFVVFFDTAAAYPFRLFVVFLHEVSHGLAAVLTGGRIVSIGLSADEGGVCVTQGGAPFVVLNAGYLGSMLWGALFLLLGARKRSAAPVVGAVGVFSVLAALVYVRTPFGFAYVLAVGLAFLLVAAKLPPGASELLLAAVGAMSVLYAPADIASDVVLRHSQASDASALARLTAVPAVVWGVAWIAASLAVLASVARRLG